MVGMNLKFRPGEILKKITVDKNEIVFRFPMMSDVQGAMDHINALVKERAFIAMQTIQTLDDEKEFVKGAIKDLKDKKQFHVVVEANGKFVGTASVSRESLDANKHVCSFGIGLHGEIRGLGIGTQLMELLELLGKEALKCKVARISVYEPNNVAKGLYKKRGFKETGRIPRGCHYYGKYYDEVIMVKEL